MKKFNEKVALGLGTVLRMDLIFLFLLKTTFMPIFVRGNGMEDTVRTWRAVIAARCDAGVEEPERGERP